MAKKKRCSNCNEQMSLLELRCPYCQTWLIDASEEVGRSRADVPWALVIGAVLASGLMFGVEEEIGFLQGVIKVLLLLVFFFFLVKAVVLLKDLQTGAVTGVLVLVVFVVFLFKAVYLFTRFQTETMIKGLVLVVTVFFLMKAAVFLRILQTGTWPPSHSPDDAESGRE